mmetsp:Transcript_57178/g.68381  ORF Transcript_57178/g.68381 Transcript_57178/m.68381 type:complete len:109 (+) Transcript_57178:284-610(+)
MKNSFKNLLSQVYKGCSNMHTKCFVHYSTTTNHSSNDIFDPGIKKMQQLHIFQNYEHSRDSALVLPADDLPISSISINDVMYSKPSKTARTSSTFFLRNRLKYASDDL